MSGSASVIGMRMIGSNGAEFDIVNGTEGVILTDGLDGVEFPDFEFQERKTARAPGRRVTGINWHAGKLTLPLTIGDTWNSRPDGQFRKGLEWIALDRLVKGAVNPLGVTTFEVTVDGKVRRYYGRGTEVDVNTEIKTLPDIVGLKSVTATFEADIPFWRGDDVTYDFPYVATTSDNYYGATAGVGPPFYISAGNALGNAVVLNSGAVESWPTWEITGPAQATVGVGEHLTYVNPVGAGQKITITTAPDSMDVRDEAGNRAWPMIGQYDFASIEPGESGNISAQIIGGGAGANIRMILPSNYLSWY